MKGINNQSAGIIIALLIEAFLKPGTRSHLSNVAYEPLVFM